STKVVSTKTVTTKARTPTEVVPRWTVLVTPGSPRTCLGFPRTSIGVADTGGPVVAASTTTRTGWMASGASRLDFERVTAPSPDRDVGNNSPRRRTGRQAVSFPKRDSCQYVAAPNALFSRLIGTNGVCSTLRRRSTRPDLSSASPLGILG